MSNEIERKFRVDNPPFDDAIESYRIEQGYLCSVPERTVRVRINGKKGYLTVKGIGNDTGASRYEWEKRIPLKDAIELMELVEPGAIVKTRYIFPESNVSVFRKWFGRFLGCPPLYFEVDVFRGENSGLTLAEIELSNENQDFNRPYWLGEEVTGDSRYYNSSLTKFPYTKWSDTEK